MTVTEKTNKHIMPTYGRFPLEITSGDEVIDFGSGIGTNSLGFCDRDWADAVCAQVKTLQHTSNLYYTKPAADFAEKLCAITGYTNMFFANSGAEANECAIKLARKYSFDKYGTGRHKIITFSGSFHGRTLTTLTATGQEVMHPECFAPYADGFEYAEPDDYGIEAKLLGDSGICAVMLEYIQGEGGVNELEPRFVNLIGKIAAQKDILVIADEVQTGAGRTGRFLAGDEFSYRADITTMAKGLFAGLPGGVCLANEKCANVLTAGFHGSTYGGNPVVTAGGMVVLNKVSDADFLREVTAKGDYLREKLAGIGEIAEISGKGLMLGLTLKSKVALDVAKSALNSKPRSLLVLTAKDKLRLLPPLNIGYDSLDEGLEILKEILQ
jgi:acetylornithine/N-succinyldiaminopimelate aminotransferase